MLGFISRLIYRIRGGFKEGGKSVYGEVEEKQGKEGQAEEILRLWDYIQFKENTQAHHLCSVIGFEEWVTMEEIKRRIKEVFGVEYKNDRSLYPYLKALVDVGFFEILNTEGKRKWRKKEMVVTVKKEKEREKEENKKKVKASAKSQ